MNTDVSGQIDRCQRENLMKYMQCDTTTRATQRGETMSVDL